MTVIDIDRYLHTHAAVRLEPPSGSDARWTVHQLLDCRRFALSPVGCLVLIAFMGGRRVGDALEEVQQVIPASMEELQRFIDSLVRSELLVGEEHEGHRLAFQIMKQWSHYGWREAADYHLSSLNYQFLDYSADGPVEDGRRMFQYRRAEPEPARTKRYEEASEREAVLSARDALLTLRAPLSDAWQNEPPVNELDGERLKTLMAVAFGQLRSRFLVRGIPNLVRKASPSGGGRHPTEGYVVVRNVRGIAAGVYHFAVGDNALEKIGGPLAKEDVARIFEGMIVPFDPQAYVVFTSVFERNMYRYREPRTFRTLFMDIGHVTGTMQVVARALGVLFRAHHTIDDEMLSGLLRLDPLTEGVLYGAALCGKVNAHGSERQNHRETVAQR